MWGSGWSRVGESSARLGWMVKCGSEILGEEVGMRYRGGEVVEMREVKKKKKKKIK